MEALNLIILERYDRKAVQESALFSVVPCNPPTLVALKKAFIFADFLSNILILIAFDVPLN